MTKLQVTLNVWDTRFSKAPAIQGENGSRIIEVTFVGKVSPIDLTGCTPRMVVNNSADQPPMNDGVIVDAAGGVADFTITSDMLERVGDWPCEFTLSGPNYPLLKANGLMLHVDASNTENAIGSTNQLASLWVALNKADAAEATAQQAAAESKQAATDSQAAVATANQANAAATIAAANANNAASAANQAANDTRSYYQMMDPTTGKVDFVTNIIKNLEAYIFNGAITAGEFDALNITAGAFDAKNITALEFDTRAKAILGVS